MIRSDERIAKGPHWEMVSSPKQSSRVSRWRAYGVQRILNPTASEHALVATVPTVLNASKKSVSSSRYNTVTISSDVH